MNTVTELLRLAVMHRSSYKLYLLIELLCQIVCLFIVLSIVSLQHLPQSSTFSIAVLRHEACEMRARSGWVVSMMRLLAMPALLFIFPFLMLVFVLNGSKPLKEMIPKATLSCLFSDLLHSPFLDKKIKK